MVSSGVVAGGFHLHDVRGRKVRGIWQEDRLGKLHQHSGAHSSRHFLHLSHHQLLSGSRDRFHHRKTWRSVTITIEIRTNGATTSSRVNLSGYVGHVTIFTVVECPLLRAV